MTVVRLGSLPKMHDKIVVIAHRRDFDGISSAAQIIRRYRNSVKKVIFTNYDKKTFGNMTTELVASKPNGSTIILADLSAQDDRVKHVTRIFKKLKAHGNSIIWLDHHPWSPYAIDKISKSVDFMIAGENKDHCGAELVFIELCKDDATCKKLSELAHITDFNLPARGKVEGRALERISNVITYLDNDSKGTYHKIIKVTKEVSAGELYGKEAQRAYKEYKVNERKDLKLLKKTARFIKSNDYTIGIAFAHNMESNTACSKIREMTGAEICIFVTTKDGTAHVRSIDGIDCSILSKQLGGGGHPQASGFSVSMAKFKNFGPDGQKRYVDMVRNGAAKAYKTRFT